MRPLSNLVAVFDAGRAAVPGPGTARGERDALRPAPGWSVRLAPLPGDTPVVRRSLAATTYVVEGAEVLDRPGSFGDWTDGVAAPGRLGELGRHPGDFGFVRVAADGSVVVARSCGGLVPLYLWEERGRLVVSTTLTDLARELPAEPPLDALPCALWSAGVPLELEGRTVLKRVRLLGRGCCAVWRPGSSLRTERYWDPRPEVAPRWDRRVAAEHAERLRDLLLATLRRDLDPAGGNLLTLSGGVDSSTLGALVRGVLGLDLSTWSFVPGEDAAYRDFVWYLEHLEQRVGFRRRWEVRAEPGVRVGLLSSMSWSVHPVPHPALCDLARVQASQEVRVLVGGEFADELCGSPFTMPDWARESGTLDLARTVGAWPRGTRAVAVWARHRTRNLLGRPSLPFPASLPEFFHQRVLEEYADWRADRVRAAVADRRPGRYRALRSEMSGWVEMNWEVASRAGVRRSSPFHTRELLELAAECHPTELVGPRWKSLLKRAVDGLVPHENLHRTPQSHWNEDLASLEPWRGGPLDGRLDGVVRDDVVHDTPTEISVVNHVRLATLGQITRGLGNVRARPSRPPTETLAS